MITSCDSTISEIIISGSEVDGSNNLVVFLFRILLHQI